MTAIDVDPTKSPYEIVEEIEGAEEDGNVDQILAYLSTASSNDHGGDEDWAEVAEDSLDAFYRLSKAGGNNKDALSHLTQVFIALKAWKEEEAIVEVALGCLVSIASKAQGLRESGDDGSTSTVPVELVLEIIKEFPEESTIQEQACLAIEGLALWKQAWKIKLSGIEGIREELQTARNDRITNERNKNYPVRAAKALGLEDLDEP